MVLKFENLTLAAQAETPTPPNYIYLAEGPADAHQVPSSIPKAVNFHRKGGPSGWHGTWTHGNVNDIIMHFNCQGVGHPLRFAYVHKTSEQENGRAVYIGHDYAGRKLKLTFESRWIVNSCKEWHQLAEHSIPIDFVMLESA